MDKQIKCAPSYLRFYRHITLERGLIAGFLLALGGTASTLYALRVWQEAGFGSLNIEHIARIVISPGLMLIIAIQTIL